MTREKLYISEYRKLVCKHLGIGGDDQKLRQREFEYLAECVEQKSGVRLSVSTLKRLWKDGFVQLPHPSTLNALVSVLGHSNWSEFKKTQQLNTEEQAPEVQQLKPNKVPGNRLSARFNRGRVYSIAWIALAFFGVAGFFVLLNGFVNKDRRELILPTAIPFDADKTVTSGVPNTVRFSYDVSNIDADSFFIQQSWDPRNTVSIDRSKHYLSSIYYYPGFHRAKLIVNDSIVVRKRIHIKTEGWMGIAHYQNESKRQQPFYLSINTSDPGGTFHATQRTVLAAGIDVRQPYSLGYYNVREFDGVNSDNFTISASIKMDSVSHVACPSASLTILTEEHIFYFRLTSPGCVGALDLKMGEVYQDGQHTDLSTLGRNLYQQQEIRLRVENKQATIFINDSEVHKVSYKKDFGEVVGIVFNFNSTAAIDNVSLSDADGKLVYTDIFE